jgi:hypothetical protein
VIRVDSFLDIHDASLKKDGEELCGDVVKSVKTESQTIAVLSDGLGSGVKATILATLTSEILVKMLLEDVPLEDVIETVIGTLPICKVRNIAYATFTVVQIGNADNRFRVINCDNPPTFYFRRGKPEHLPAHTETIQGKKITVAEGTLEIGDFLGVISDGLTYAGLGQVMNFGWGWDSVARFLENHLRLYGHSARAIVTAILRETDRLYQGRPGDDATFLGIYARRRNSTIIFTGPPLDPTQDEMFVERLFNFNGRRIVSGGTTANIVAGLLGEMVQIDLSTMHREVPPIGTLPDVDLVTEGILTLSRSLELLRACDGELSKLPFENNGAVLLARELLRADFLYFLVGQKVNEFYQNPILPQRVSIRRHLIEDMAEFLRRHKKEVVVEYC